MENIKAVDKVKIFDSDEELIHIIRDYNPAIMVVGGDWRLKTIIGGEYAGEIQFFDRVNNILS
jgi:bifunctional ADP-heptose synthase (sugar kinase/adenylyltransferase)